MARARRRRNRLSMTSLIDVIFLLLLFFMLSSTFAKFSEIELFAATTGQGAPGAKPLFLQLGQEALTLNGAPVALDALTTGALAEAAPDTPLLVALRGAVTSQRLADLLVALRPLTGLRVTVLEG